METYNCEYLVLGAGAAGCPLASLLSKHFVTILLEAGQNADRDATIIAPLATVPYSAECNAAKYYWQGITCANPNTNNRQFQWTNGRLVGGGSSINGSIFNKGSPLRLQQWADIIGPEWGPGPVYKDYKKMEQIFGPPGTYDEESHGKHGKMAIRVGVADDTATPDFTAAIIETGVPGAQKIIDYNNPNTPIGVFDNFQYFQFPDGTRASASRTFLDKNVINKKGEGVNCHKLFLLAQTTATQLIWSDKENRVEAVIALKDGKPILIKVSEDVIVSMGFNSSAFLQVNGVGPRDILEKAGVRVRVDLANVGQGLKNNFFIPANVFIPPPGTKINSDPATFYSGGAFLPDPRPGTNPLQRDVELSSILVPLGPGGSLLYIVVVEAPLLVKSNGSIKIDNADPLKIAKVDIGFLNDPADLEMTVAVYQLIMKPLFLNLIAKGYFLVQPSIATIDDPVALREFIRNNVSNGHHYMAFNRMAPKNQGGVTDAWGSVYGTKNLRIVDDSIAPLNLDGNTNGIAELIGFRIARHIIKKYKKKSKESTSEC